MLSKHGVLEKYNHKTVHLWPIYELEVSIIDKRHLCYHLPALLKRRKYESLQGCKGTT